MKDIISSISDFFAIKNEVTVPTLITLFVFFIGLMINMIYSFSLRYTLRKMSKIHFKRLIREIHRQAMNYEIAVQKFSLEELENYSIEYQNIPSIEVFNEIGYEKLFKAYFSGFENIFSSKKRLNSFVSLIESIEYIKETFEPSIIKIEDYNKGLNQLTELRNVAVGECIKVIERFQLRFLNQLDPKEPLTRYYNEVAILMETWMKLKNRTLPLHVEKLLQDIKKLNNKDLDLMRRYNNDTNMLELNFLINDASIRYQNSQRFIESNKESFIHLSEKYFGRAITLITAYRNLHNSQLGSPIYLYFKGVFLHK